MNHYCKAGSFTTKVRICCQLGRYIFFNIMVRSEQHTISVISQCAVTGAAVVVASNIDDVEKKQMSMLRLKTVGDTYLMNKFIRQNFAFAIKNTLISWLFQR